MDRCDRCQQLQGAGTPSVLVPTETRRVQYPHRKDAQPAPPPRDQPRGRRRRAPRRDDPGGWGVETVREIRCCPTCAAELNLAT